MNKEQKEKLLRLARDSIKEEFKLIKVDLRDYKEFNEKRGVFVTLTINNQLRGCIGIVNREYELREAIYKASKSSAFYDPRFISISKKDLDNIKIEISILSVPEQCSNQEIEIGKHGIICEYNNREGLLLPQVATEYNLDMVQFLETLCEKAGLSRDAWREEEFKLFRFEAEVFSE